jgi:transcription factor IIIB 90 kDa subunit
MAGRSVSFGEVEEQVYEEYDYEDDDEQQGDDDNNYYDPEKEGTPEEGDSTQQQHAKKVGGRANNTTNTSHNNGASNVVVSSLMCPNCASRNIETDISLGASVCTECGTIVEDSPIVSAVEFQENAGGSSSMIGQFVSATSSKAYTGGAGGPSMRGRYGYSKDSRETTLANGRRRIQDVASRLRLGNHFVDAAHRLFTIAVEKNFVQGRRTLIVVASCLYIACRQEKSQHMLIDFSDALQINVYTLGTTFLKFRRLLGLKLEIIDPALYVYRFAAHLDLDEKSNAVAMTSLRLIGTYLCMCVPIIPRSLPMDTHTALY